jgi:hypothetical protein
MKKRNTNKVQEAPQVDEDGNPILSKQERAQQAMLNRSRKQTDPMASYYGVIAFFIATCLFAIGFTIFNPKQKFSEMQVLDEQ